MSMLEIDLTPDLARRIREEAQIQGLSPSDYVRLSLKSLINQPAAGARPKHNVMEFAGAGRRALEGVDVDRFIHEMRAEWDEQP